MQWRFVGSELGNHLRETRFEHERHRVVQVNRIVAGVTGFHERVVIRAVRQHAVVQTDSAWHKTLRLRIVLAVNVAHQLGHDVLVIPRRTESILLRKPAWWEDDKVDVGCAFFCGRSCKYGEDRRVGVVKGDRSDRRVMSQVVLIGCVVSVPGNDVQGRVIDFRAMEFSAPFHSDTASFVAILEPCGRSFEVTRIGQAVGADRAAARQREFGAIVFADESASFFIEQIDFEHHAPW